MADEARALIAPDSFPFLGLPGTDYQDGTILLNEDSGEAYFWNAHNNKWEPLE